MSFDPLALLVFARDNKFEEMQNALKLGLPPDTANGMGQTALHIAGLWGNYEVAKVLLDGGADPNVENSRGQVPLHFAANARQRAIEICQLFLDAGASTDIMAKDGRLPFEMAEDDHVRAILGGPDGRLFQYAEEGLAAKLKALLEDGSIKSIRALDGEGRTALNIAVTEEKMEVVKTLVEYDQTCLDFPDGSGNTGLHCAAVIGNPKILSYILSFKPHINYQNVQMSEYAAGNWMLHGETIMPVDKTALHVAIEHGDTEAAQMLLDAGANPDVLDFDKRSPLHLALEEQDVDLIGILLQKGADVNLPAQDFVSCCHFAATRGPSKILKMLLDKGANVNLANDDGWLPIHLACRSGGNNGDKVSMLLAAGSPSSPVTTSQLQTPLHLAAANGNLAVCKLLLEAGADRGLKNKDGRMPSEVAKTPEIAALVAIDTSTAS